jgi:hypothetical protein
MSVNDLAKPTDSDARIAKYRQDAQAVSERIAKQFWLGGDLGFNEKTVLAALRIAYLEGKVDAAQQNLENALEHSLAAKQP